MSKKRLIEVIVFCVCLVLPSFVFAEPTYDDQGDLIRPNSEKYVGTLGYVQQSDTEEATFLIINDSKYKIDQETIFRNISKQLTGLSNFSAGMQVEYYAIDDLVTKIMAIPREEDEEDVDRDYTPD